MIYTICHSQQSDQNQGPYCHSQEQSDQVLHFLPFSAVWSGSTLFAILSLIRVYTICHSQQSNQGLHYLPFFLSSIIKVSTVCHSQQFDQGLHYLPFSAVWSGSTLFTILSRLKTVYTLPFSVLSGSQFEQCLQCLPFWAVCSESTLLSQQSDQGQGLQCHSQEQFDQGLHYMPVSAFWSGSSLFAIHNLIRVFTICHSQYDQGQHHLPFSAIWLSSTLSFSAVWSVSIVFLSCLINVKAHCHSQEQWSRSTLFEILRSLIRVYTVCNSQSDQGLHSLPFSVWSGSTLFAILSSSIRVSTTCHSQQSRSLFAFLGSMIKVYNIYHSQQSDQGLHYLPFSAVWSRSTLFANLSNLISVYTICHSQQSDRGRGLHCHFQEQSDQGLHHLPFKAVCSMSALFAIHNSLIRIYTVCHSQQSDQGLHCLPFSAVLSRSKLFVILSSLNRVYNICHFKQSDQGLHCLPFTAVWAGSTLFAILSLNRVYTIFHSQQSDQGLHYMRFFLSSIIIPFQGLHYLPFSAVWSGPPLLAILSSLIKVYIICHSQQSDQGLHYMPFLAVWSRSTLFVIQSSLIKVKVYTVIFRNSLIRVYTICHSKQSDLGQGLHCHSQELSDQGLHYLPFSAVWSRSTLFAILSSLINVKVYTVILRNSLIMFNTICHSQQSDQGLQYLQFFSSGIFNVCTLIHSQQSDQGLHYLPFSAFWSGSTLCVILSSLIKVYTICHSQQP